ncbi:MAG: permease YjgP/YjgQ family protein [Sphingobacteriaceae bacterium]|nr:permease YjgP/YjgQ family protein [Sphingobacteriaceae bacterium]
MKKIHLLVFKAFIRPFIVTFFIVMFVLLMLFLYKYIDDLIGKGFGWTVILQLLWYASATQVAMALPLAMLLSSIMTFGSLGENYELVAIKAAGISLQKAMFPLLCLVGVIGMVALLFSNYILPIANLKMGSLLWDVTQQKASPMIQEGVFNNSFQGYTIRVQKKGQDGQTLNGIIIYDHTTPSNVTVTRAEKGKMYITDQDRTLALKLFNGVRYEESNVNGHYDMRQRFIRYRFKETEQKFDLSAFKMQRTNEDLFKNNYAMLNLKQLKHYRDSFLVQSDSSVRTTFRTVRPFNRLYLPFAHGLSVGKKLPARKYKSTILEVVPKDDRQQAINNAQSQISSVSEVLKSKVTNFETDEERIRRFIIEYQRKFTLAISCLVLFSIGAPLGAIIRKGGLGMPVVMSIIFFLIFHIISTISEKSAKDGSLEPILGMWLAIIILTPLGVFLTYKATVDSAIFNIDNYKQFFVKLFKKKKAD